MRKSYEVLWADVAENDLLGILAFIAEESPDNVMKIMSKVQSRTDRLKQSPMQGRVVPELLRQGISLYREVVVSPWRLIYKIDGKRVFVVSVLDSRRNVEDILLGRLLH